MTQWGELIVQWPWSSTVLILLTAILASIAVGLYSRQKSDAMSRRRLLILIGLRLLALACLLLMLIRLSYSPQVRRVGPLWVAIDRSQSMLVADEHAGSSSLASKRFVSAAAAATSLIDGWLKRHTADIDDPESAVQLFIFESQVQELDRTELAQLAEAAERTPPPEASAAPLDVASNTLPTGDATELFAASSRLATGLRQLDTLAATRQPSAVVVITDAAVTDQASLDEVALPELSAKASGASRVFGLQAGVPPERDRLAITRVDSPTAVFAGDNFELAVGLAIGDSARTVDIRIEDEGGKLLATQEVRANAGDETTTISVNLEAADVPLWSIRVIASWSAETAGARPAGAIRYETIPVRREPLQVLLIAGGYSYETRFVRHLLQRQRRGGSAATGEVYDLTSWIAGTQPQAIAADDSLISSPPLAREWWTQFDACICIDSAAEQLDPLTIRAIERAVTEDGMGLIVVEGEQTPPADARWLRLLPVTGGGSSQATASPSRWSFAAAAEAFLSPGLVSTIDEEVSPALPLTPSHRRSLAPTAVPIARWDAEGDSLAAALRFAGAGRSLWIGTDELYRWRTYRGSQHFYDRLWGELIAAAIKPPQGEGEIDASLADASLQWGRPQIVSLTVDDKSLADRIAAGQVQVAAVPTGAGSAQSNAGRTVIGFSAPTPIGPNSRSQSTGLGVSEAASNADETPERWQLVGRVESLPPAQYRLTLIGSTNAAADQAREGQPYLVGERMWQVVPPPGEAAAIKPQPEQLAALAKRYGGQAIPLADAANLLERLPPPALLQFESLPPQSVWNHPLLIAATLSLLSLEWFLRHRWGLV